MIDREECTALDAADPLRECRQWFALPEGQIYLDGNSLGPPLKSHRQAIARTMSQWESKLINGWWDSGWVDLARTVGEQLGPLIGAPPGSVVFADNTTINLYKAAEALLDLTDGDVLTDLGNFPTDLYVLDAVCSRRKRRLIRVDPTEVMGAIGSGVGLLSLTDVDFRTGRRHDITALSRRAKEVGAFTLWDLSHSAGVMPIDLSGADAAVGCGYKFLNGGPGAPAFLYLRPGLELRNPVTGWFSHQSPFEFAIDYVPAAGIERFRTGTPHILSLVAMGEALTVFERVSIEQIRAKSLQLTGLFLDLTAELGLETLTPQAESERGSQVSLRLPGAKALIENLAQQGVIADYRPPDVARFGFSPLYLSHQDAFRAVEVLGRLV